MGFFVKWKQALAVSICFNAESAKNAKAKLKTFAAFASLRNFALRR